MSEIPINKKPFHLPQLDALRFLAAFMVVFVHAYENWINWFGIPHQLSSADPKVYSWFGQHLSRLIGNFNFGVDMFFLISGFLITYLLLKEKKEAGKINIKNFFVRRILRIWPLYFFIIALSPLLVWWMGWPSPEYKPVIFFYNNFRTIATERWDFPFAHFWSICIEEHFYLVWPFLVALIPTKRLPFVFLSVMALSIGYRYYAHGNPDVTWYSVYLNTISRIDALALGGLVAWIHFHKPFKLRMPVGVRILIYVGLLWALSTDDLGNWPNSFEMAWKKYFYLLLAGLMMMNYVFNPEAKLRWGPNHPINYLGRCCFGIYLWGNILLQILLHKFILVYLPGGNGWIYWPVIIGISLLVPIISYELIEKPFMRLKSRFAIVKTRV